jgi:hypothetical protein
MAVEIHQLIIRATILDEAAANAEAGGGSAEGAASGKLSAEQREQLIAECVEQVMASLREQRER